MASRKRSSTPTISVYSSHRLLEARSLAMHAVIAAKIEREPKLLSIARSNLKRWRSRWDGDAPAWHQEWCEILDRPWFEIAAILTAPSEEGARLRQSSPFAGVLSPMERRRVYDAFRLEGNASDEKAAAVRRGEWRKENAEAITEYNELVADRSYPRNLAEFFAASPLRGSELKTRRSKDRLRSRPRLTPKL